jgi:hypothetical protein
MLIFRCKWRPRTDQVALLVHLLSLGTALILRSFLLNIELLGDSWTWSSFVVNELDLVALFLVVLMQGMIRGS